MSTSEVGHSEFGASDPRRNLILRGLSPDELDRVLAVGEVVAVDSRDVVYSPEHPVEHVYFPFSAVFSHVATVDDGIVIEVGTIGLEGMVGVPAYLGVTRSPHAAFCQVPGVALRVSVVELAQLQVGDGTLHEMLNRNVQALMVQMAQNVACNRVHTIEERAARWLLTTQDRVGDSTFPLTQQFLAQMLGVRRPTVSSTASKFQSAGMIGYTRGIMTINDRHALASVACDCYQIVRDETGRLMQPPTAAPE